MVCVDCWKDFWMLVDDFSVIEFQSGNDIVIIIDLDIQDIVEWVLNCVVNVYDVEWGIVIVFEVEMGVVWVIVNFG